MQVYYDNLIMDVKKGTKIKDLFSEKFSKMNNDIIACRFNNEVKSLNYEIMTDGKIELIDITNIDGMRIYNRALIFVIGKAFYELYPEVLIEVNYQLYHSMLCMIDNLDITDKMIINVKKRVKEIIEADLPITKKIMSKTEARKFYEKEKTLRGKLQLDLKEKKEVTLYYCEDYYNYFYGVMPISTGCIKEYDILKYHNGFLIRYPSRNNPYYLKPLIESPKLLQTLDEYENVHKILNVNILYKLNQIIKENKVKDYILLDEALHEKKIAQIADEIYKDKNIKVILIARTFFFW